MGVLLLPVVLVVAVHAQAATYTVSPGMSIQGTLDKASPGDTVQVLVGVYQESLTMEKEGLSLVGMPYDGDWPLLNGAREFDTLDAAISIRADNVSVSGFAIRNYRQLGVLAENVAGTTIRDVIVEETGAWGIKIVACQEPRIERCVVSGARAAGIYLDHPISPRMRGNETFSNGVGIHLENASQSLLENNSAHNNAVGIVVRRTPEMRGSEYGSYCRISNSRFFANNREPDPNNKALPAAFAPGIGLLVIAADYTEVMRCTFTRNDAYAAMVMGHENAKGEGAFRAEDEKLLNPDHTHIHHNTYRDNGAGASNNFQKAFKRLPPGDLYWDETGERNQFQEDRDLKTVPEKLVTEHGGAHTNVMHFL